METWSQGVVLGLIAASGPEDKAKVAIIVLNMVVSFMRECVLAETQDAHDTVINPLGTSEVWDRDVDVIDADSLGAHGVNEPNVPHELPSPSEERRIATESRGDC